MERNWLIGGSRVRSDVDGVQDHAIHVVEDPFPACGVSSVRNFGAISFRRSF